MKLHIVALLACAACVTRPPPPEPPRPPAPSCASACGNMRAQSCPLGEPTRKGASCEAVCELVQRDNLGAGFDVACLTRAMSCHDAEDCR